MGVDMLGTNPIRKTKKAHAIRILKELQHENGLFSASRKNNPNGYNKAWVRDNVYETIGLEKAGDIPSLIKTFNALFDIFIKHEYKIDGAIAKKPGSSFGYIHARYNPFTLNEYRESWGNKQNDAIGAFLFKVAELHRKGISVIRDSNDKRILQKLVNYLASIEYWHDPDSGMWEENEEIHSSSIGACLAGLIAVQGIVNVHEYMITNGISALNTLLPRESETKEVDLALLSLIYPFKVVSKEQAQTILKNVEEKLLRERGLIRYAGDRYYGNQNGEAEWTFGFPWLAVIYKELGNKKKYDYFISKTHEVMNSLGELPELYFAGSRIHNENSPLGWAHSMYLAAVA